MEILSFRGYTFSMTAAKGMEWLALAVTLMLILNNNRKVGKALATEAFKAGSEGWDWSMGSIQDP